MRRVLVTKKLLVASIGVASVSYAACTKEPPPQVGNLMPVPALADATPPSPVVGNLMPAPVPEPVPSVQPTLQHVVGNLMPPRMMLDAGGPAKR